jgi:peroxiredoxin
MSDCYNILLNMSALAAGVKAPEISLPTLQGPHFDLSAARKSGPVAIAFFKISCPVCQMAFPFFERLHKAYRGNKVHVIGVSQDSAQDTSAFARQFGITFPIALDDAKKYPASNAYGLTNVPTLFLIGTDGTIEVSSVGWSRDELEQIGEKLAAASGAGKADLVRADDNVPAFKPG